MNDPSQQHSVRLRAGGMDLSALVLQYKVTSQLNEATLADIRLSLDGPLLAHADLRGDITLEVEHNGIWVSVFRGVVTCGAPTVDGDGQRYDLTCKGPMQLLAEYESRGAFGKGMHPTEIIYYLLMLATPRSVDKANLPMVGGEGSLADQEWRFASRRYVFIAPLPMCRILDDARLAVAGATLYSANGQNRSADDAYISSGLGSDADIPLEWSEGVAWARLYVQARSFLEAFELGRERLRKVVDYLSFAANFSTPTYRTDKGYCPYPYERRRTLLDASEAAWAYVRDVVPHGMIRGVGGPRYWLRWFAPHRRDEPLILKQDDSSLALCPALQHLLEAEPEHLTRTERNILSALHALRRARQAEYTLDGLHHLFQCMEFLVNTIKVEGVFTEQDRKALRRAMVTTIDDQYGTLPRGSQEYKTRTDRIGFALSKLDEPTLKVKWDRFCTQCAATITSDDQAFLFHLRKTRNEDVHGGVATVDRSDVERGAVILEKAIAAILVAS